MVTGEMYMHVIDNPKAEFRRVENSKIYRFNDYGKLMVHGDCESNYVPKVNEHWELIIEPVSFMEAVNSGKKFKPQSWGTNNGGEDKFRDLYENMIMFAGRAFLNKDILNGKWYIEQ